MQSPSCSLVRKPRPGRGSTGAAGAHKPPFELLPAGSILPRGWMLNQLRMDLEQGIQGRFPCISSNVSQNLFASQTRQPGTWVRGSRGHKEKAWWAGEHEGYWIDSMIRSAIMVDHAAHLEFVSGWIERVLGRFAQTGYVGIYNELTRFPSKGFDGELWTQSRAFQGMLAWYEYCGDRRVLEAVEATVRLTVTHYRDAGTYFGRPDPDGGVSHGAGYMDTLEWLWRLTGDPFYADAAVWLYADYSGHAPEGFNDLIARKMCDRDGPWSGHGAHIGEALHLPAVAHFHSGRNEFAAAADHLLHKLNMHTNPGGGMALGSLESVATSRGGGHVPNELCAHIEAMMSLSRLMQYRPDAEIGAWQERCMYNAVQGARLHPANRAVIYLSRDNRLHASDPGLHGGRELFSACHEAAACCVLTSSRAMPYYVETLWYRSPDRQILLANGYGPNKIKTEMNGVALEIETKGNYPFSDRVQMEISVAQPVAFTLHLRIPSGAGNPIVQGCGGGIKLASREGFMVIDREWSNGDTLELDFDVQPVRRIQPDGREVYWTWGPLVFSHPFAMKESSRTPLDANPATPSGCYEYLFEAADSEGWDWIAGPDPAFVKTEVPGDDEFPWVRPPVVLEGSLCRRDGHAVRARLSPMGSAPLRRTTFPLDPCVMADAPATGDPSGAQAIPADHDPMRHL